MFGKKYVKQFFKYLLMFMIVIMVSHISGNDQNKCLIISIVSATSFIVLDYLAPSCNVTITADMTIENKCGQ